MVRPGLVQRLGGEGRRAPAPPCSALPALPTSPSTATPARANAHWKLAAIDAHAGDRPLAWIDDALDERCERWAADRAAPTLLVRTDPAVGLTAGHVEDLVAWARTRRA